MPRTRLEITDEQIEQIEKLSPVLNQEQLADFLGMSERTFRERKSEDERIAAAYKRGRAKAIAGVATSLLKKAQDGNMTAIIFFLKTQAGWRETERVEMTGADGKAIQLETLRGLFKDEDDAEDWMEDDDDS